MGSFRAFTGFLNCLPGVAGIEHGHGSQTHEGTISGAVRIGGTTDGIPCFQKGGKGGPGGAADIETCPCAAQVSFLPPAHITFHLIFRIESPTFNQAFGKAEGHGGIIGPLAGLEVERAAADHVGDGREAPRRFELQSCSQGVADGEPEEAAPISFELFYVVRHAAVIVLFPMKEPSGPDRASRGTANAPLHRNGEAPGSFPEHSHLRQYHGGPASSQQLSPSAPVLPSSGYKRADHF